MRVDWSTDFYEPNNPSMNSAIVEEGSVASGDGCSSYAARRRNLACRPLALGRTTAHTDLSPPRLGPHKAPPETLPFTASDQPADPTGPQPTPRRCPSR